MNDLVIKKQVAASIVFDKAIALKEAKEIMSKYVGLEFSEDDLPDAKKELATLRKLTKEINSQALKLDKELTKEVKDFRADVKEVIAEIDKGVNYINEQVQTFEEAIKDGKRNEILELDVYDQIKDYNVFNEDWLLKKFTLEDIITECETIKKDIDGSIGTIKLLATSHNLDSDKYIPKLMSQPLQTILERIVEDSQLVNEKKVDTVIIPEDDNIVVVTRTLKGSVTALKELKKYADKIGVEWSE